MLDNQQKVTILNMMKQMSFALSTIESERDAIKEMIDEVHDKTGIEKPILRSIGKTYHKRDLQEKENTLETLSTIYNESVAAEFNSGNENN